MDIRNELIEFISVSDNNGALLLTGQWVVGKTHLVKDIVKQLTMDEACVILTESFEQLTNEGFTVGGIPISTINKLYVAMTRSKGNLYLMSAKSFKKIKRNYLHC